MVSRDSGYPPIPLFSNYYGNRYLYLAWRAFTRILGRFRSPVDHISTWFGLSLYKWRWRRLTHRTHILYAKGSAPTALAVMVHRGHRRSTASAKFQAQRCFLRLGKHVIWEATTFILISAVTRRRLTYIYGVAYLSKEIAIQIILLRSQAPVAG